MDDNLKKVVAHHDWWSEKYDSDYFERLAFYHQITLDNLKRFLPVSPGALILDAGGGTGIWSVEIARLGYRVVLTDLSEGMLAKARAKIAECGLADKVEIRISDIRSMPEFADAQFDMVVCQGDPLSYCGDNRAAVREFARVVKPGGAVIASVDNRVSAIAWYRERNDLEAVERLLATGDVVMPHEREDLWYTIHAFTPDELRELFESHGLTVERIIGKPVLAYRLVALMKSDDPCIRERIMQLELAHSDDPLFVPWGGHLEIVGRRR